MSQPSSLSTQLVYSANWNVTWATLSNPQPSLGNGSLTGRVIRIGNLVWYNVNLRGGTTTTWGTSQFTFDFPFTPTNAYVTAPCYLFSNGAAYDTGIAVNAASNGLISTTTIRIAYGLGNGNFVTDTGPVTWGQGAGVADALAFTMVYEAA